MVKFAAQASQQQRQPPPLPPAPTAWVVTGAPPPPPAFAGGLGAGRAMDPRVVFGRRRSDPTLDVRSGLSLSGRRRGASGQVLRGGSLECLQYVGHLVHDLLPHHGGVSASGGGGGDESDVSSEASSYSAVVAHSRGRSTCTTRRRPRSRRASVTAAMDSDADADGASSSGVSSLGSAFVPVVPPSQPSRPASVDTLPIPQAPKVLHPSGVISPDAEQLAECVIWYQGRNLLDLGWHLRCSPWPLRYAALPAAAPLFFLANRSQYHRLGPQGLHSERPPVRADTSPSDVER